MGISHDDAERLFGRQMKRKLALIVLLYILVIYLAVIIVSFLNCLFFKQMLSIFVTLVTLVTLTLAFCKLFSFFSRKIK